MTTRKMNKKARKCKDQDRLSNLPDNILHKILSYVDTTQAVQTSVLSKQWEHLWKSLPALNFQSINFTRLNSFKKFVLHVLNHHDDSCSVGEIFISCQGKNNMPLINKVINYAISHHVQSLDMDLGGYSLFRPSQALLKCHSIKTLKLRNIFRVSIPESSLSESLTTLHLSWCSFNYNAIDPSEPFASYKNLKTLHLSQCAFWGLKVLKICLPKLVNLAIESMSYGCELTEDCKVELFAPKLSFFSFASMSPLYFSMLDVSSLEGVNIDIEAKPYRGWFPSMEEKEKVNRDLINMFQGLHNAQFVTLSFETIMVLTRVPGMLEHQPSPFSRLKVLKLRMKHVHKLSRMPARVITYLLGDSAGSATLQIESQN